jgi:maleylpyruvate isomerase
MTTDRPQVSLGWLDDGTSRLFGLIDRLPDAALGEPSGLPGWDRLTLLAHLALNARALANLVAWARTGEPTPMYPDPERRAADIVELGRASVAVVRQSMVDADATLRRDLADLPDDRWSAEVRTFRGRAIPASEIPWMRNREVWVHAVDLAAGVTFADVPDPVLTALVDDAAALMSPRPDAVSVAARTTDTGREWWFGPETAGAVQVAGPLVRVCGWALGRERPADWPVLPPWL